MEKDVVYIIVINVIRTIFRKGVGSYEKEIDRKQKIY